MQIIRIDRRGNFFGNRIFTSFQEVYDYCLEDLSKSSNIIDDLAYSFKIIDSDEIFKVYGHPNGEESYIHENVSFKKEVTNIV